MAKFIKWKELQKFINFEQLYIKHGGQLTSSGNGWYKMDCKCPFHDDNKSGGLVVHIKAGVCHCFVCNESHNLPSFISRKTGMSYREALELLESEVCYG